MEKKLQDIIDKASIKDYIGLLNEKITSIEYDSRKCVVGSCFVAIKGNNFDGHNFIEQAIDNGAKAIVCENYPNRDLIIPHITYLLVNNTREALAELAHSFYDYPTKKLKVIGITGTNGKTTTTYIIKSIVEAAKEKVGIIGTTGIYFGDRKLDTNLTTPESSDLARIFYEMIECGINYAVMEVSSVALIMNRVDKIEFDVAGFSNLTQDHLDIHHNMEEYANAKKILFDRLEENSIAVINSDDEFYEKMINNCVAKIRKVGRQSNANYKIIREEIRDDGNSFLIFNKEKKFDVRTKLSGKFNVENAALAALICDSLNIPQIAIQNGLSITEGAPGRLQKVELKNGAIGYVDYAHTPDALEKALNTLKQFSVQNKSRLICVFGCGGDRDRGKRPLMGAIAEQIADQVIITNDNPRTEDPKQIFADIIEGINNNSKILIIEDRKSAIEEAVKLSNKKDLILVAGKGHENYQIIGKEKFHFDDFEELSRF